MLDVRLGVMAGRYLESSSPWSLLGKDFSSFDEDRRAFITGVQRFSSFYFRERSVEWEFSIGESGGKAFSA
jgi:hypothetical protein